MSGTRHVALLRAVNVGGQRTVAMADLRATAEGAGFGDVVVVSPAGSLVFAAADDGAALERRFEAALADKLGLETCVMVRSGEEWARYVADNPFPKMFTTGWASRLLLLTLKGAAKPGAEAALREAIVGPEEIVVGDGVAYATFPGGIGRSKLTPAVLKRHLGTPSSGRNWNTVLKIADALGRRGIG